MGNKNNDADDFATAIFISFFAILIAVAIMVIFIVSHDNHVRNTIKTTVHFEKYGDIVFNGIPIIHSKGSCISGFVNDKLITICNDVFYIIGESK